MQSAETLANLQKVLTLLDPATNLEEMLTRVGRHLVEMFEVDHCGVLFFGLEDLEGTIVAEYPSHGIVGMKLSLVGYPLAQRLKREQKPAAVFDAQNDPSMGTAQASMRTLGIQSILIIPLIVKDKLVGGVGLDMIHRQRHFTPAEIELGHIIGNQIAVAVDYTRALETAAESSRQSDILQKVNQALGETLDLDEILPLILEQLEQVIPVDGSSIYLWVEGGVQLKAWRGEYNRFTTQQIIPLDDLWGAAKIFDTKSPLLVTNTRHQPGWIAYPDSPLRSWLGVPLIVRGQVVGVLNMDGYAPNRFDESHIPPAWAFARQSAIAINNAKLYGQAKKRAELLASVQEIEVRMASLDLEDVLNAVTTAASTLLNAGQVRIYLYDEPSDSFTLAAMLDTEGQLQVKIASPRKSGLTAHVARTGEFITIPDVLSHPLYQDKGEAHGFRAITSVPLKKGEQVLGVLNAFYAQTRSVTTEEMDVLQLLTTQAAVAIENARLYSVEQARLRDEARRAEQWRRIQDISSTLNASLDLDEVLNTACEQFVRLMGVDHCGLILFETGGMGRIVAEYPPTGMVGQQISIESPAFRESLESRHLFHSFDAQNDERLGQSRVNLQAAGIQSILIAPLVVHDRFIGSIGLDSIKEKRHFTEEELNLTRVVADQMAIAVTNAQTYQAERAARIQADTLREVAAILNETLNLDDVLARILGQLERVIDFDSSSIILRDDDAFHIVAGIGFPNEAGLKQMRFTYADAPHFQVIASTRRPIVIPDTRDFVGWRHDGPTPIRSWIGVPLLVSNRFIGVLSVDHLQSDFYQEPDSKLVTGFADLAAVALENARLYEVEVKQVEQELSIASQIQRGFLPNHIPDLPGWAIAAACIPARETGGDFYEFVERTDGLLGVVVGDVSGKSIPAAMLMASAQSVVSAKGSDYRSPAEVMSQTNRLLYGDVPKGSFVALSYALLRPDGNQVCFSNGGQLSPFLVSANGQPIDLIETPGNRLPLGILPDLSYQERSFTLLPGDSLVFYTDGLIEQNDKYGGMFGFESVRSLLEELRGQPPAVILNSLLEAAHTFANGLHQHDDVTLVVVQRLGS